MPPQGPGPEGPNPAGPGQLARALRLLVVTDERAAAPRSVAWVVEEALRAGAAAVQLRAKDLSPCELLPLARALRSLTAARAALLFVNDRFDVALAAGADGVHLGPEDLPVRAVRRAAPDGFLVGYSTDDPEDARRAETEGADYLGCGAVWGTRTKPVGDEAIGLRRLEAVCRAVRIPVLAIGGITPPRARRVARTGAAGVAVVSAVMAASDPGEAVTGLLQPFLRRGAGREGLWGDEETP